jgi:hypothetical protein
MTVRTQIGAQSDDRFARNGALSSVVVWLRRLFAAAALAGVVFAGNAAAALAAVPNPGGGLAPPGSAKIVTILQYLFWGVSGACVAGVLIVSAKMAIASRGHHGGGEHAASLGWVLVATVLAGSASGLIGALI